jgi:hypothetical protein
MMSSNDMMMKGDQAEQISIDKDQAEFIYSVAVTSIRLIDSSNSANQSAQDLLKAWQQVAEIIASKGDISVSDIGISTA